MTQESLKGRVIVVAGATRGAGRGIACAFGEAGATVICTGRSTDGSAKAFGPAKSDYDRQETIEETAQLVTSLGGKGIPFVVDHLVPDQVRQLATHVGEEFGHVDVLVNDIWGAEKLKGGPGEWDKPIWEFDLDKGLRILRLGIDSHLITSHYLMPLVMNRPGGLVVEITDGTNDYNDTRTRLSVFYDLAKVAVNRLAFSQGNELSAHRGTAVAISPGWMRSELMLENFHVTEEDWREAVEQTRSDRGLPVAPPSFILSETPRFVGRAVVAIASDADKAKWNQKSVDAGSLAREYGFTDVDGSQPDVWRYMIDEEKGIAKGFDEYR